MGSCNKDKMSEIEHQLSDSEDSSDIGSGTASSDSSSGSESESSSEGENVPMTRMNSRKIKLRKEIADSKASEVFTKMLEKNNINNTNKQTLGSALGSSTAGNLPFSTKNILIRSAKTDMENLQLVFKKSSSELGSRIKTIPDVSGRFVQKIEFGGLFALLLRILLIPCIFGSIFVSAYLISDKIENYMTPESDIQELHFFLTSRQEDVRYPRRPEMIASVTSIITTPLLTQFLNRFL